METRYGMKVVQACPQEKDGKEGYKVVYEDGYESWSPKDAFEKAYRVNGNLTIGHVIDAVKYRGKRAARAGWNGSGMFIYYVPAAAYPPATDIMKEEFGGQDVPYREYLALKTAQGDVATWAPSGSDALAEDWYIID